MNDSTQGSGSFAPLKQEAFAILWAATILGNTGTFMRDLASSWLITDLTAAPAAIALVQAAGTLPTFMLAIPAGVLSDILDRRRFLMFVQLLLVAISLALMGLSSSRLLSIGSLIGLTFLGGISGALAAPTWQAIVPEIVSKEEVKSAVALNSLGVNVARSLGPALGGLLLAAFGAKMTYGVNAFCYVVVIAALFWWRRPPKAGDDLPESFSGAFRSGLRYVRASRELKVVLLRSAIFFAFASAVWSLLPLISRELLRGTAGSFGLLFAAIGVGAIAGALGMPWWRKRLDGDGLLLCSALIIASVIAGLALAPPEWLALVMLTVLGGAWITALTTLNGAAQAILPNWVRGRGLAVYLTVFNGAMAAGSIAWGAIAQAIGLPLALAVAGAGLSVAAVSMNLVKLPIGDPDLVPSNHWPEPLVAEPIPNDRGPVLVLIDYYVKKSVRTEFLDALAEMSHERRRDGAYGWGVAEDSADPDKITEWFMVESWAEHLRQHRRVSHADADLQEKILSYHSGPEKPVVRHLLSVA